MGLFDIFKRHRDVEYVEAELIENRKPISKITPNSEELLPVSLSKSDLTQFTAMQKVGGVASKVADAYMESKRINANIKTLRLQTNAIINIHAKHIAAARECLVTVFAERSGALNKHYEVLSRALQTDDRELILASLQGISSIVTANPLDKIAKYVQALQNPKEPLFLDF